jgi:hypothetical protein
MKVRTANILIHTDPTSVFDYMDQIGNTGMHMTHSSMPMLGGHLQLQQLSEAATGLGSSFRWYGKVIGFKMDFTVVVTEWTRGKVKVWETVGDSHMIILSWYQMRLMLSSEGQDTRAELSIAYNLPTQIFFKLFALFLAPWYARWCLTNMLQDSKTFLEYPPKT